MAAQNARTDELIDVDSMAEHFLAIYVEASDAEREEGRRWYPDACRMIRRMAREGGVTHRQAAAIFAVYSTNNSWKGNVTMARNACKGDAKGMRSVLAKVDRIVNGEKPTRVLASSKLQNFYRNLSGDFDAITVDRWMARAAWADGPGQPEGERYAHIAAAIRQAASMADETPAAMQAILWVAVRGGGE